MTNEKCTQPLFLIKYFSPKKKSLVTEIWNDTGKRAWVSSLLSNFRMPLFYVLATSLRIISFFLDSSWADCNTMVIWDLSEIQTTFAFVNSFPHFQREWKGVVTDANHGSLKSLRCAKCNGYLSCSASIRNYRKIKAVCACRGEIINKQVLRKPLALWVILYPNVNATNNEQWNKGSSTVHEQGCF